MGCYLVEWLANCSANADDANTQQRGNRLGPAVNDRVKPTLMRLQLACSMVGKRTPHRVKRGRINPWRTVQEPTGSLCFPLLDTNTRLPEKDKKSRTTPETPERSRHTAFIWLKLSVNLHEYAVSCSLVSDKNITS